MKDRKAKTTWQILTIYNVLRKPWDNQYGRKTHCCQEHQINAQSQQLFQVSRTNLLLRLKGLGLISESQVQKILAIQVKTSAREYGYDKTLYEPGNEGVFIGDFGEKARALFESGKISEGHYFELLNMISAKILAKLFKYLIYICSHTALK